MDNFIKYLRSQVDKAIYVWGGQGQNLTDMTDAAQWIKAHETSEANSKRAIALFDKRKAAGVNPIRCFDCSGLIVYFLYDLHHAIPGDRNTKGLYSMAQKLSKPEKPGDLVWYSKTGKPDDISHVGVYVGNDNVIEAYGRDYGVIETKLGNRSWTFAGRLKQLEPYLNEDSEFKTVEIRIDEKVVYRFLAKEV